MADNVEDAEIAATYLRRVRRVGLNAVAQSDFDDAMLGIIRSFNLSCSTAVPWQFPPEVRSIAEQHFRELITLFESNRSKLRPQVGCLTRHNADFQRFLGAVTAHDD